MIEYLHFGWPQIAYLVLIALGAGLELAKDGQPKEGKHNFGVFVLVTLFVTLPLLYAGGFFTR